MCGYDEIVDAFYIKENMAKEHSSTFTSSAGSCKAINVSIYTMSKIANSHADCLAIYNHS